MDWRNNKIYCKLKINYKYLIIKIIYKNYFFIYYMSNNNITEEPILICPHCNHFVLIEKINCCFHDIPKKTKNWLN